MNSDLPQETEPTFDFHCRQFMSLKLKLNCQMTMQLLQAVTWRRSLAAGAIGFLPVGPFHVQLYLFCVSF